MLVTTSRSPAHRIIPRHIAMEVIPTMGGHVISYQSHRHLRPASGMMHNIALHKIIMWGDHQPGSCHIVSCHITLCEQLRPASPQSNTQISLHLASHCEGKSKAVVNTSDQIRSDHDRWTPAWRAETSYYNISHEWGPGSVLPLTSRHHATIRHE